MLCDIKQEHRSHELTGEARNHALFMCTLSKWWQNWKVLAMQYVRIYVWFC